MKYDFIKLSVNGENIKEKIITEINNESPPAKGISPKCLFLIPSGLSTKLIFFANKHPVRQQIVVTKTTKDTLINKEKDNISKFN